MTGSIRAKVLASFQPLPLAERWFVRARLWSAPLVELCSRAPGGAIADIGCGHGVVSALLAIQRPDRRVIAIDPDPRKIEWARAGPGRLANVSVRLGTLASLSPQLDGTLDGIVVADVLYLLPRMRWGAFLADCRKLLKPGGQLLLKETEANRSWKHWKCLAQEWLMVKVLRKTQGDGGLQLLKREAVQSLLEANGFQLREIVDLSSGYTSPHVLFVATAGRSHPKGA